MNQPFDEELISAYLDDELSDDERRDVERLLAERPEAQRLLDELRGLRENLQALPTYRLQEDFGAAVLRRAEREMLRGPNSPTAPPSTLASASNDEPTPGITQPASTVERNWRRPAAWSLLAVAAAAVLMYVERRGREAQPLAMHRPAAVEEAAGKAEIKAFQEKQLAVKNKDAHRDFAVRDGDEASQGALPITKAGAAAATFAKPSADAKQADKLQVAGQPLPPGNQMLVTNSLPSAPAPAAPPPTIAPPATPAGNIGLPPSADQILNSDPALASNQVLLGNNGFGGIAPPAGGSLDGAGGMNVAGMGGGGGIGGGVSVIPLIASNDYYRALTLVSEYTEARNQVADNRQAAVELSRRVQQAPREQAGADRRDQPASRAANEQLLIVQCDVTPEGLQQGLAPILRSQQIADLTSLQQAGGQVAGNLVTNAQAAALNFGQAADREAVASKTANSLEKEEEFFYVVAETKQLEATLDALRRQSEYFVNVQVEPAPTDARRQAWRSYNRGQDAAGHNFAPLVVDAPAQAAPPTGLAAAKPTAEPTAATAKQEAEKLAERKLVDAPKPGTLAKSGESLGDAQQTDESAKLRQQSQTLSFGGGNAPAGQSFSEQAPASAAMSLNGGYVPQISWGYGNNYQAVVPMSRVQRLSRADVAAAPAVRSNLDAVTANVAQLPGGGRLGAEGPTSGGGRAGGKPSPSSSAPPALAAAATAPKAGGTAPKMQSEAPKEGEPKQGVDALGRSAEVTLEKRLAGSGVQMGYDLPPDYREVLFIFHVVNNKPTDAAKPSGASTPAKQ